MRIVHYFCFEFIFHFCYGSFIFADADPVPGDSNENSNKSCGWKAIIDQNITSTKFLSSTHLIYFRVVALHGSYQL